jgi:PAS domain S-box-containing protein
MHEHEASSTALTRAEADYNRLFNLSLDLLCIAGLDGYFKRVNPSWTRVLGWSEAELLARPVEAFMHPEDRLRTLQARAELAKGTPVRGLENRYMCKDGSSRWLSWQSVIEPGETTVFAVARDITERRKLDDEHLVLSKLESTGVLAAGIAHDFNNLLASLLLNLEFVSLCGSTTVEQEVHLDQARQTVNAARSLTQQLITFADGGAPDRRACDVKNLLGDAMELALKDSTIQRECEFGAGLWPARVDEGQIGQVMRNLILNAREATSPDGVIRLRAENVVLDGSAEQGALPGEYVRISVLDNGIGIPPEILPRIFDPYFSTKQRGSQKGMGLGLTICRMIIGKHGGTIRIGPRAEGGTSVVCHLPAIATTAQSVPPLPLVQPITVPRVLVMDDEALFLEILNSTLCQLGYEVGLASDGNRAVALFEQAGKEGRPFHVVLLDLTVRSGMGGIETVRVLREHDPEVRAVLMTGYCHEPSFREYARHGFKAALEKPFSATALRATLMDVLQLNAAGGLPDSAGRDHRPSFV